MLFELSQDVLVSVTIKMFELDGGGFGIAPESFEQFESYVGFDIAEAGITEDDDGFTLILYRKIPPDFYGLLNDTYCYPCFLTEDELG